MKRIISLQRAVGFILCACIITCAGCGGSYNAEKAYWKVNRKYGATIRNPKVATEKDFQETVNALKGVIAAYPSWGTDVEIQMYLGEMYAARGDFKQAEEEFARVYVAYSDRHEFCSRAMFSVGLMSEKQGDWPKALSQYQQVMERYPASVVGLQIPLYIAGYYAEKGNTAEAGKAYQAAIRNYINLIEVNPYDKAQVPVLEYLLVNAYSRMGKWNDAIASLDYLAKKYPKSEGAPLALYHIAAIYRELNQSDKSMGVYRRIIEEYPQSRLGKSAQVELGNLNILQGDMNQAQLEFGKVFQKYQDDISLCAVAQLAVANGYEKAGRWEEALTEYKKLQKNYPYTTEALQVPLYIARYYQSHGQPEEGNRVLVEALAGYQGLFRQKGAKQLAPAIQDSIASAYGMMGKWEDALKALETLRTKYPNDPRSVLALVRMGVIHEQGLRNTDMARRVFIQFLQEYPNHNMAPLVQRMAERLK